MRSLIPNMLLILGSTFQRVAMWLTVRAINLHMKFKTKEGEAITKLNEELQKYMDEKGYKDEIKENKNFNGAAKSEKGYFVKKDPGNA